MDVAAFVNLEKGDETDKHRLKALRDNLPANALDKPQYGGGEFIKYPYKAQKLIDDHPNADIFFSSCWNTLTALDSALTPIHRKPIVYAALVTHSHQTPPGSTGIRAFDLDDLCPYWPALLKAIKPGMTQAAIVYDSFREGPRYQYTVVSKNPSGLQQIIPIPAIDANGNAKQTIGDDITRMTNPGDGLIVSACTVTGLLREQIGQAVHANSLVAICPERMYVERANNRCLMSYGPNLINLYAKAATDFIIPIVRSGTLPPEQVNPLGYELVINSTIANALNIHISPTDTFTVTVHGQTITIPITEIVR